MRSSTSSMPTEMRTRPSVMPIFCRSSGGTEAWVMGAGCEVGGSAPARPSPEPAPLPRAQHPLGGGKRAKLEGEHRPEAFHLLLRQLVLRVGLQAGVVDPLNLLVRLRERGGGPAVFTVR